MGTLSACTASVKKRRNYYDEGDETYFTKKKVDESGGTSCLLVYWSLMHAAHGLTVARQLVEK